MLDVGIIVDMHVRLSAVTSKTAIVVETDKVSLSLGFRTHVESKVYLHGVQIN